MKKKCSIWRTFAFINEPFCREKICFVAVGDWEFCCGEFGCGGLGEEESGWVTVELWVKYPSREKQPFLRNIKLADTCSGKVLRVKKI